MGNTRAPNPFALLVAPPPARKPKATAAAIVVNGKRVTTLREIKHLARHDEDIDVEALHRALKRLRNQVNYQRLRQDPERMAQRRAYYEANRDKILAWKRDYAWRNNERVRKVQATWAQRLRLTDPQRFNARQREYYARNRERLIERNRDTRRMRKGASLKPHTPRPDWTPARHAWLEEVERNPHNRRARGQVGFQCFQFGWTEWRRDPTGQLMPHEQLTEAGRAALQGWREARP